MEPEDITIIDDEDPAVVEDLNADPTYEPQTDEPPAKRRKADKPGNRRLCVIYNAYHTTHCIYKTLYIVGFINTSKFVFF